MRLRTIGAIGPILWIGAEIISYGLIIQGFGIAFAILIGIISLALGLLVFRRLGLGIIGVAGDGMSHPDQLLTGLKKTGWAAFGAFLLILPGFLSNGAGLTLLLFNSKSWLFPPSRPTSSGSNTIELEPDEWNVESETTSRDGKHRPKTPNGKITR